MSKTYFIIIAVALLAVVIIILLASNLVKKAKRNALFNEEQEINEKNNLLYEQLVEELERTKKISKNEESINLYNSWIEEFEKINLRKESIDSLFAELENFYLDKDHKNFITTYSELEGKKYKFDEELKNLYKKVKQYTEYELENTRISLTLKTEIKELTNVFQLKLEILEIFNTSFYNEITIAQNLIASFEQHQRDGDYPEGRNVLKKCNRAKNKIKNTLEVILKFYDYILDLEDDLNIMNTVATEINKKGFKINIRDFERKVTNYTSKKEKLFEQVISITFNEELDTEFVKQIETQLNDLNADINELKDIVEEKYNFIEEIRSVISKNEVLIEYTNELVEQAAKEKQEIFESYEIESSNKTNQIDSDIERYVIFKKDYIHLLEMIYDGQEDYATSRAQVEQSRAFLEHIIHKMKNSLIELRSVRDDEIKASEHLVLYNTTLIQIDLFLRKYQHRHKLSQSIKEVINSTTTKLDLLRNELVKKPINIHEVRALDNSIFSMLKLLVNKSIEQDIKRRLGAKKLMQYCAIYNTSEQFNLTIKKMYTEYDTHDYSSVIKDANELLTTFVEDGNGANIYLSIVDKVEKLKFSDVFRKTVEQYNIGDE